jgi:acetyl esterase/lipase
MQKVIKRVVYSSIVCLTIVILSSAWKNGNTAAISIMQQDTLERNVIYGSNINSEGKKQDLVMDIYYPKDRADGKKHPMVMLIHGGTFLNGKKEDMAKLCKQMADSGFVAVTIDYRLGWNVKSAIGGCKTLDANSLVLANYRAMQDAHAAMRFLAANAAKYQIDTKWLFIGGGSAGAIMALNVAYANPKSTDEHVAYAMSTLGGIDTAGNTYTTKFKLKGICDLWGALSDSTLITKRTALPTIFFHGTADGTVPYDKGQYIPNCDKVPVLYGSACLYRQTVAAGQVAVFNTSVGGKHSPAEFTTDVIASNTACFFHRVMRGTAKSAAYYNAVAGCR